MSRACTAERGRVLISVFGKGSPYHQVMTKVVFLCKGTRGDVHPVLSIALSYKQTHVADEVVFVCSSSSVAGFEQNVISEGIHIISSLPSKTQSTEEKKLQLLKFEAEICYKACLGANIIVFNLFTLEGYIIARELGVHCIAVSPFLLSRTPPTGFEEELKKSLPEVYKALKSTSSTDTVSYAEVEHWMWRLFLDDYGSVCEHLGFSSNIPFSTPSLPPPTPLLYGVSSVLTPRQPYWPKSVQLCGYWFPSAALQCSVHPDLSALVKSPTKPLVYIGFGSMESYMVNVDWTTLLCVLESALRKAKMKAIFQCQSNGPIQEAFHNLTEPKLLTLNLWDKEAPHQWLFQRCVAILHHGGAGTVAASLLARKPQLISPVLFDQEHWGELVAWKNLGVRLSSAECLTAEELALKLKLVSSSEIHESIDRVYTELVKEDGINTVLNEIERLSTERYKTI